MLDSVLAHWLGIPVAWSQISGAKIIIEASPQGFAVDPSQGSHFFHNITSLGVGYFTIPPGAGEHRSEGPFIDWKWLDDHPAVARGVQFLVDTQEPDGTWDEPEFTGTGFPQVFYLRYHYYPIYFPLMALSRWAMTPSSRRVQASVPENRPAAKPAPPVALRVAQSM